MKYTVTWLQRMQQRLAAIWLVAPDRQDVTAASNRIDRLLAIDPDTVGTLVYDDVRELIVPPLAIEFEISEPDRLVTVVAVWRF